MASRKTMWTEIAHFEHAGHRYVVAREERVDPGLCALSSRELQIVACLATGQTTKEAAYSLGISDATVRVLVARATTKLGVENRRGLLAHPEVRRLATRGDTGGV